MLLVHVHFQGFALTLVFVHFHHLNRSCVCLCLLMLVVHYLIRKSKFICTVYNSLLFGYHVRLTNMHYLYYTLRGIRRFQCNSLRRLQHNPITIQHLFTISGPLAAPGFFEKNKAMWCRVTLLAFFGSISIYVSTRNICLVSCLMPVLLFSYILTY